MHCPPVTFYINLHAHKMPLSAVKCGHYKWKQDIRRATKQEYLHGCRRPRRRRNSDGRRMRSASDVHTRYGRTQLTVADRPIPRTLNNARTTDDNCVSESRRQRETVQTQFAPIELRRELYIKELNDTLSGSGAGASG